MAQTRWRPLCVVQLMVDEAAGCQGSGPASPWHFPPGSTVPSSCRFVSWGLSTLWAESPGQQENGGRSQEQDPSSARSGEQCKLKLENELKEEQILVK